MNPIIRRLRLPLLAMVLLGFSPWANAVSCSASIASLNFGTVPTLGGSPTDAQTTISYTCTGTLLELTLDPTVVLCVSLGSGTGGSIASSTAGTRKLANGANKLEYNLYRDGARSQLWGSGHDATVQSYAGYAPTIELGFNLLGVIGLATASGTTTIYGRVFGGQTGAVEGTYTSSFDATQVQVDYGLRGSLPNCNRTFAGNGQLNPTFTAQATVQRECSLSATDINFGTVISLGAAINGSGSLTVNCNNSTPYQIGLGAGLYGSSVTDRKLKRTSPSGSDTISYSLYRDAARTQNWGNTLNVDTVTGTGNGQNQSVPLYARVPVQATPTPGTYTDQVIATITY